MADVLTPDRPRILVAEPQDLAPDALDLLRTLGDVVLPDRPLADLDGAFADHDVVWIRLGHRVRRSDLGTAPRCRILAVPATGLDHVDLDACAELGVRVVSLRGEVEFLRGVRATAEHTLGLLLAATRRTVPAHASVLAGEWDRDRFRGRDLAGRTAGVVGVGRLGTIVAGYLAALGMTVIGHDVAPGAIEAARAAGSGAEGLGAAADLDDLLDRADVVTLHVAYHEGTHHLVDARALARMRPGSVLVNTSRGGVVDPVALVDALELGHLGAAALDVVEGEPDITASPLWTYARHHSNLVLTPHIGGNTLDSGHRTDRFLAERVRDALAEAAR